MTKCCIDFAGYNDNCIEIAENNYNNTALISLNMMTVQSRHVSVRNSEEFDSFFYLDECDNSSADWNVVSEPESDCQLYPVLLCNGVRNCDDCVDEDESFCLSTKPCTDGWLALNKVFFCTIPRKYLFFFLF